jgi:hypothetical protein
LGLGKFTRKGKIVACFFGRSIAFESREEEEILEYSGSDLGNPLKQPLAQSQ